VFKITPKMKKTGGTTDVCENKRVEKKGIHKGMKIKGMQIDGAPKGFRWEGGYSTPGILWKEAASY